MSILPADFYAMEFTDFMLMRQGWIEKVEYDNGVLRHMTFILASCLAGSKNVKMEKWWPVKRNKKKDVPVVNYGGIMMPEKMAKKLEKLKGEQKKKGKKNG